MDFSFSYIRSKHFCFHFAREETKLTKSQCPRLRAPAWQSWASNPSYGTLHPMHLDLMSRGLVTDHWASLILHFLLSSQHSGMGHTGPHSSGGLLVASLTQNFPSPSNLSASATFTFLKHFLCVPPMMTDCQFLLFPTTLSSTASTQSSYSSQMGPPGKFL